MTGSVVGQLAREARAYVGDAQHIDQELGQLKGDAGQRSWLLAYRRTLEKTMYQARSMDQVVTEAKLDWLDTPDRAVVWATALGLGAAVEDVLSRTMDDTRSPRTRFTAQGGRSRAV